MVIYNTICFYELALVTFSNSSFFLINFIIGEHCEQFNKIFEFTIFSYITKSDKLKKSN